MPTDAVEVQRIEAAMRKAVVSILEREMPIALAVRAAAASFLMGDPDPAAATPPPERPSERQRGNDGGGGCNDNPAVPECAHFRSPPRRYFREVCRFRTARQGGPLMEVDAGALIGLLRHQRAAFYASPIGKSSPSGGSSTNAVK
jgi:hypothetical protein